MARRTALIAGAVTAALVAGLGATQLLPGAAPSARASGLVGYRSCDELLQHYRDELERSMTAYGVGGGWGGPAVALDGAMEGGDAARASSPAATGSGQTGTNLQEQGVDEPDLAKLRDGRLVVLTGTRLRVLSAEAQPRLLGSLGLGSSTYSGGGELLLVGDRALLVLQGYREQPLPQGDDAAATGRMSWIPGTPTTRLVLVDLAGDDPRLVEEATYDARYVSARLVDGTVRLVTTTYPQVTIAYPADPGGVSAEDLLDRNRQAARSVGLADVLPRVVHRDVGGAVLEQGPAVACDQTSYAPGAQGAATLMVTTLRPEAGLAPTDRTAVTTDGDLVYASADRLYVATSRWGTIAPAGGVAETGGARDVVADEVRTQVHAFDTSSPTTTAYVGSGSVPGYVYGRWALSEHEGVLRVATTRQPPWTVLDAPGGGQLPETSSMVVKLAEQGDRLVETGRVAGLGRTEHIRAVRYFGDLAAVVTFRQTDPLYLLDLGADPRVLGELKIPGFSTYLHPIGDGLLLGIGQDATEQGQVTGMQVSVFDIADPSSPRQVDRLALGQGWSPALDDSRAFTYDPDLRVAGFAFQGYDAVKGEQSSALGVRVSPDGSLSEAGRMDLGLGAWAARVLMAGGTAYAVSESGVVAGDALTMTRTGSVTFGTA